MRYLSLFLPFIYLFSYSQKCEEYLVKINEQCELIPRLISSEWSVVGNVDTYCSLIKKDSGEFLSIFQSDSEFLGYYDSKTPMSNLRIRLSDCDTEMFYSIRGIDTTFVKGYYQYLFDQRKLSEGQQRFFRRNIDSLVNIRGGSLKELPELNTPLE